MGALRSYGTDEGRNRVNSTSAGGAAEGSQGQALGAPPLGYVNYTTRPEKGVKNLAT